MVLQLVSHWLHFSVVSPLRHTQSWNHYDVVVNDWPNNFLKRNVKAEWVGHSRPPFELTNQMILTQMITMPKSLKNLKMRQLKVQYLPRLLLNLREKLQSSDFWKIWPVHLGLLVLTVNGMNSAAFCRAMSFTLAQSLGKSLSSPNIKTLFRTWLNESPHCWVMPTWWPLSMAE